MLVAIQLALGPKIRLSQWGIAAESNAAVMEGAAWLQGRLDLPNQGTDPAHKRMHDTACYDGKVYNVFPPLLAFLTVALAPLHKFLLGRADIWVQSTHLLFVFWPLPITGFFVFRRQVGDSAWAAVLTVAWMGGTALLPNIAGASTGLLGQINHVLSQVGLLILAADCLGRRRIWPSLIGLAISTWTRQMTALFALPLLWVAWKEKKLGRCLAGLAVVAAPLLILNHLKFGSPLDFGYRHIYVNRDEEPLARRCRQHGLFSPHFLPENFYYMHIAPPRVDEVSLTRIHVLSAGQHGTSIWITSPFLVFVLISAGPWLRDPTRRALMLGTLPVMLGNLCYHGTGFLQDGYNRFALDFLPIWLVVAAPWTRGGWRTWLFLGCVAWSLLYFQQITPNQAILASAVGGE
ncbi:MAG: hypothetical protein DCC65_02585 [Planctomycetota bacterium]|nr:MAG: hypothetical protein DCC65_02585 [Planctomycetota bacterium]